MNRGWDDYLFWMNAYFSSCLNALRGKRMLIGEGQSGEVAPAYQVIKKLKIESSVALHAVSYSMLQRLQNVIK